MKKHLIILMSLFSSIYLFSQVGINTENPQQLFHTDGKSSAVTTNPTIGIPEIKQQEDDVVITNQGRIGIGTITPTESLDVNGRTRIRNTDVLTSTSVSPIFVDENGLVGKANINLQSQIAFYTSKRETLYNHYMYNRGQSQSVLIRPGDNSINSPISSAQIGFVKINQSGNYLISASLNFVLRSLDTEAKIFMNLEISISSDKGMNWTPISLATPVFVLYSPSRFYNHSYTFPTTIRNLNEGDLIRIRFYRIGTEGNDLEYLKLAQPLYGLPIYTLSISKL